MAHANGSPSNYVLSDSGPGPSNIPTFSYRGQTYQSVWDGQTYEKPPLDIIRKILTKAGVTMERDPPTPPGALATGNAPSSTSTNTGWSSSNPIHATPSVTSRTWLDPDHIDSSGGARVSGTRRQMSHLSRLEPPSFGVPSLWRPGAIAPPLIDSNRATRIDRTVKNVLPPGGKDYNRGSFASHVAAVVCIEKLVMLWSCDSQQYIWQLTFTDIPSRYRFIQAGDFSTREGHPASVTAIKKHRFPARVYWTPYHIPMAATVKQFESISILKIVSAAYDKSFIDGLQHVRIASLERSS
jgi:hypothetical protein